MTYHKSHRKWLGLLFITALISTAYAHASEKNSGNSPVQQTKKADQIYRYSSNWPVSSPVTYREFHKDVSTGTYTKNYAVEAWLHNTGEYICGQYSLSSSGSGACKDADQMLRIENAFVGEDARKFYDMRERLGCFLIHTGMGAIEIISFISGRCSVADQKLDELLRRNK